MKIFGKAILLLFSFFSGLVKADNSRPFSVFASAGTGMNDVLISSSDISNATTLALGLGWNVAPEVNVWLLGPARLSLQGYRARIRGYEGSEKQSMNILAIRPVFRFDLTKAGFENWFWEGGVGVAKLDTLDFKESQLSTHGQFASILGVGRQFAQKQWDVTLRYNHYSNGYIKRPNPGIDTLTLDVAFNF